MFWERFYSSCADKGLSPNALGKMIGVSSGIITKWKSGALPNGENLIKIADCLDCSVDYLLGRTDRPELEIRKAPSEEGDLIYHINKEASELTEEEITTLKRFAQAVLDKEG